MVGSIIQSLALISIVGSSSLEVQVLEGKVREITSLSSIDCSRCLLTYCDESKDRSK